MLLMGDSISVCDIGRLSGVEDNRDRRVWDEVAEDTERTEPVLVEVTVDFGRTNWFARSWLELDNITGLEDTCCAGFDSTLVFTELVLLPELCRNTPTS